MLSVGIVGLPNVGKSTVFNALSNYGGRVGARRAGAGAKVSNYPFCTIEPNRAIVPVPDPRLDRVAGIFGQPQRTPTTVEFVDIAGLVRGASRGEGLGNQFLSAIREVDAILHVVRCFPDAKIAHVEHSLDPVRDLEIVELELALADLGAVQRRQEKVASAVRGHRKEAEQEAEALARLSEHLNAGMPARTMPGRAQTIAPRTLKDPRGSERALTEVQLLTDKPVVYVANVGEQQSADGAAAVGTPAPQEMVSQLAAHASGPVVPLVAKLEADLAEMEEAERAAFVVELKVESGAIERVIKACYQALDLVTFFTGVGAEARAWAVPRGTTLADAAGRIHTDMERGFIRAEVIGFGSLDALGDWHAAHQTGKVRAEGRDYLVQDGDVILVRFQA
jgi:GTP-binding protein YchF